MRKLTNTEASKTATTANLILIYFANIFLKRVCRPKIVNFNCNALDDEKIYIRVSFIFNEIKLISKASKLSFIYFKVIITISCELIIMYYIYMRNTLSVSCRHMLSLHRRFFI